MRMTVTARYILEMTSSGTERAGEAVAPEVPVREGFRSALRSRDFAMLFGAEVQSIVGDQLGRVALSFLVFMQTGSAASTGLTYALTYLPAILGGTLLGGIADRFPRHRVMVCCDLVRAALFALMALPGLPLFVVAGLLIPAVLIAPVFTAAQVSYLAYTLSGERFRAASGLRMIAGQTGQVAGFALGGIAVVAVGARPALMLDAATFLISALIIAFGVSARPRRRRPGPGLSAGATDGTASGGLWRDPHLRTLVAFTCLAGFFIVPEGLAVPIVAQIGAPDVAVGVLLAMIPLGSTVGAVVLIRFVPHRHRDRVARAMAVACGLPLVLAAVLPGVVLTALCWFVSGVLAAYQVEMMASVARAIPDGMRARTIGRAGALLLGAQGFGLIVFAALTQIIAASSAIGVAGGIGSAVALLLVLRAARSARTLPRTAREDQASFVSRQVSEHFM